MTDRIVTEWPKQAVKFDSEVPEEGQGGAWIQWKGTNVCMDVHCRCGAHGHVDDEFTYFYRCAACKETFVVGAVVRLYPIAKDKVAEIASRCCVTDENPNDSKTMMPLELK